MQGGNDEPILVAIVEDDRATLQGLRALIDGTPGYRCVGAWGSVEEALARASFDPPRILLLDIDLPGMRGSEGVVPLLERHPDLVVLMLTVYDEEREVFESICNGAQGYLLKSTPPARLLEAIAEAAGGGAPMSPHIALKVLRLFQRTGPPPRIDGSLTPRELELLGLLAEGHSYRAAGEAMGITANTVRNHVRSVYEKLHVHSRSEAVSKAIRAGLV